MCSTEQPTHWGFSPTVLRLRRVFISHFSHQLHTSVIHSMPITRATLHLLAVGFSHGEASAEDRMLLTRQGRLGIPRPLLCWPWVGSGRPCPLGWPTPSAAVPVGLSRALLLALAGISWCLNTLQCPHGSLSPTPALQDFQWVLLLSPPWVCHLFSNEETRVDLLSGTDRMHHGLFPLGRVHPYNVTGQGRREIKRFSGDEGRRQKCEDKA